MMHIFFGVSPVSIGVIPFEPVSRTFEAPAASLGIDANPEALVEAVPAISGYVGGDITSDLQVSKLAEHDGLTVLIEAEVGPAAVLVGLRVPRVEADGLNVLCDGLTILLEFGVADTAVAVGLGHVGLAKPPAFQQPRAGGDCSLR